MKKYLLLLLVTLCASMAWAQESPDGFYYENYTVFMTVRPDNSYNIQEVMNVNFTEQKHGIYRTIPSSMWVKRDISEAQDRSDTVMRYYPVDININRCNLNYQREVQEGVVDVRIGSADRYLFGSQPIILDYDLQLPDDRVPQADLFFHSVIGTGNPCTIQKSAFRIYFEKPLPNDVLSKIEVYSGQLGDSRNRASEILTLVTPDSIGGYIENMRPYQSLSVYIPLPEGYFNAPRSSDGTAAMICIGISILLFIYVLYKETFRNNKVTKVVTFYPPEKISSAEVGTLFDCSADDQDLVSLIPWFANFGYIEIYKSKENQHLMLKRVKSLPDTAPQHQRLLFEALFPDNHMIFDTTEKTSMSFGKSWLKAKTELDKENRKHFDNFDLKPFLVLLLGIIFCAFGVGFGDAGPDASYAGFCTLVCFGIEAMVMAFFSGSYNVNGCLIMALIFFVGLALFCSPLFLMSDDLLVPKNAIYASSILCFVASLFPFRFSIMTQYRRQRMGEILGLQEFIRTADQERLKMLLTEDGRYFYKVLPYAIAFGYADRWAAQFKNLITSPEETIGCNFDDIHRMSHFLDNPNIKHGITAEQDRAKKAAEKARAAAARSRASSGSSWSSGSSYSSGGGGYSGGGSGGGGSRSW